MLSTKHVQLIKVVGNESANQTLDNIKIEITGRFQIGRIPTLTANQNKQTWHKIESKLAEVKTASFEQIVVWCKGHDHPAGGHGFVDYCIKQGWLVAVTQAIRSKSPLQVIENQNSKNRESVILSINSTHLTEPELLDAYMATFFGYGNLSSPLWFIGMEEGVGEESLSDRLDAWSTLGKLSTVDIREFHRLISESRWFDTTFKTPQIQKTWKGPILAAFAYFDLPVGIEEVR